ncbi:hypothetical protein [Agromyces sp. CCNWLW203]|uniref:hypothetical protein n=1 Tax=Agromyces sp. CCNWLW203 TaxID=3112842 RepID=UPI002F967A58
MLSTDLAPSGPDIVAPLVCRLRSREVLPREFRLVDEPTRANVTVWAHARAVPPADAWRVLHMSALRHASGSLRRAQQPTPDDLEDVAEAARRLEALLGAHH